MATAAEAVVDQRLTELETMCLNLTKRVEVLKAVLNVLALEEGKNWERLVARAARRLETRKLKEGAVDSA